MIYLDNAATTIHKPPQVAAAVTAAMSGMGNASRGTYGSAISAAMTVHEARSKVAKLLGCRRADHVAFTSNSTEALNVAINGLIRPGSHVITTDMEHNSVLRPLYRLEDEQNVSLSFVPADRRGCVDCEDFERLIRPDTAAIVCTHASNLTGNVVDIAKVGQTARSHGLLLIVDASQTAGALPVNMEEMNADALCFTGHKSLMGPQGTGGLCVREGADIRPLKVGGTGVQSYSRSQPAEMPTRLEAGTLNSHGISGLSAALDFIAETGVGVIHAKEERLMRLFYDNVSRIDGVTVYGDFDTADRAPIVALNIRDYDSDAVADELYMTYGIAVRPGAHCAPRMHKALGTEKQGAVRFSFSWYNTEEEALAAAHAAAEIAKQ